MTDNMLDEWPKGIREETQYKENPQLLPPLQPTPKRPKASRTPEELIIKRYFDALGRKPLLALEKDTYPPLNEGRKHRHINTMTTLTTAKEKPCRSTLSKASIYEKMLPTGQEEKDTEAIKHLYQNHIYLMKRLERLLCS